MKSILTMAWTAEDPSAFDLAAKIARTFDARLVGLEPPSYGVMSMAWADAGMGAPIGGGLAEDAEERQRVAAVKQAFDQRAAGLVFIRQQIDARREHDGQQQRGRGQGPARKSSSRHAAASSMAADAGTAADCQ